MSRRGRQKGGSKVGASARALVRAEVKAAVRRNLGSLAKLIGVYLGSAAALIVSLVLLGQSHLAWFVAGLAVGGLALLWQYFLSGQGYSSRFLGADAERWTAEALAELDARVWRVVHDVPIAGGNVDHVVIGPGRVFAIETKWTSARGRKRYLIGAAAAAAKRAAQLERSMADQGCARTVVPILVVWGGGVADELGEKPKMWGRARVVAGHHADVWVSRIAAASDRLEIDWPAQQAIARIKEEQRDGARVSAT